jgi:hypothetical protein
MNRAGQEEITSMQTKSVERAPYGRERGAVREGGDSQRGIAPYHGETYYHTAVLNPSHYRQLVATYLFLGGIAGASQVIAAVADLCGPETSDVIVRAGRYLALGGGLAGPAFLVADLPRQSAGTTCCESFGEPRRCRSARGRSPLLAA